MSTLHKPRVHHMIEVLLAIRRRTMYLMSGWAHVPNPLRQETRVYNNGWIRWTPRAITNEPRDIRRYTRSTLDYLVHHGVVEVEYGECDASFATWVRLKSIEEIIALPLPNAEYER